MKVDLLELNQRGEEDFDGLSETEKDLYSLFELDALSQMEGFEHYFITDRNVRLARIISFLDAAGSLNVRPVREMYAWIEQELGTWEPDAVEDFIFRDENSIRVDRWGRDFDEGLQPMWAAVTSYLKNHCGVEIADEASPSA